LSSADVTNTRSFDTAGLELPGSGSGDFHRTFRSAAHDSGGAASGEQPVWAGPRKHGQSDAAAGGAAAGEGDAGAGDAGTVDAVTATVTTVASAKIKGSAARVVGDMRWPRQEGR
jgi:hypothetical protein